IDLMPLNRTRVARRDLVLIAASAADSLATGEITGVVTGQGRAPVRDAVVSVPGLPDVRTAENGRFTLRGIPAGSTELDVRAIGMSPFSASVEVVAHDTKVLEVQLERLVVLDTVQVKTNKVRAQ